MGSLFGGGSKREKAPPVPPPPEPVPMPPSRVEADISKDVEMRKVAKRQGFKRSILTGALAPNSGKKTVMGA